MSEAKEDWDNHSITCEPETVVLGKELTITVTPAGGDIFLFGPNQVHVYLQRAGKFLQSNGIVSHDVKNGTLRFVIDTSRADRQVNKKLVPIFYTPGQYAFYHGNNFEMAEPLYDSCGVTVKPKGVE